MKILFMFRIIICMSLLASGTAMATPVVVEYTGTVFTHHADISYWGGVDPLEGVTTFSGTWEYDTNATKSSENDLAAGYIGVSGVMHVGAFTYNFPDESLAVYNDDYGMLVFDGAGYLDGYPIDYFMNLYNSSVDFHKAPPATLDLAWFSSSAVYFDLSLPGLGFGGSLTSLHSVPEPSPVLLLGGGLCVSILWKIRSRKLAK